MSVVGCYQLDLYCDTGFPEGGGYGDNCPHKPLLTSVQGAYYGPNERACMKQARRDGWKFSKDNFIAICPGCVKDRKDGSR